MSSYRNNNYYSLSDGYNNHCNCFTCSEHKTKKTDFKVKKKEHSKENYGAFSLRGSLRPPYGSNINDGCDSRCSKCAYNQCESKECQKNNIGIN